MDSTATLEAPVSARRRPKGDKRARTRAALIDAARQIIREQHLDTLCPLIFSPVAGEIAPQELAEWVLADRLPVRFQLQLHKLLWGNMQGK